MPYIVKARILKSVQSTSVFSDFQVLHVFVYAYAHSVLNTFVSAHSYAYRGRQDTTA